MQTLTKLLAEHALRDRIFTDNQLSRLIEGPSQRRYYLVNRAIKAKELIRLRRGLYVLADKYRSQPCHPYALAQMLVPGSYVSLETALAFHGWIPEAVYTTSSIVPGRKTKDFENERMGRFTFHPLAIQCGYFLEGVQRIQLRGQPALVAGSLRALMDLVCLRKVEWTGMEWIEQGLRIDSDSLGEVTGSELRALKNVYKHKKVWHFLNGLEVALGLEFGHD
jgi:hypothetical protein